MKKTKPTRMAAVNFPVTPEFKAFLKVTAAQLNMTVKALVVASVEAYAANEKRKLGGAR